MSTPQDPFAPPPAGNTPPAPGPVPTPPGVVQPGVVQPGLVASPTTQPYPTQPFPAAQYGQPEPPKTIALWAIILTGVAAATSSIPNITVLADWDNYAQGIINDTASDVTSISPGDLLGLLLYPAALASYIFLALWMHKIRGNLTAIGKAPGGVPAVEWWGWFVPLANYILPVLGMRAITRPSVNVGLLVAWWTSFCVFWLSMVYATVVAFSLFDFDTGRFAGDIDSLNSLMPAYAIQVVAIAVSWIFLTLIIRTATAKHLED